MKIDICLTATDNKSIYINQIPTFIKIWSLFGIEPKIILIHHEIPERFRDYSNFIILFDPALHRLEKVHTAYLAQTIRIFYPALFSDKMVMISDIDIMPISKAFFLDNVKDLSDDVFVNYRRYHGQLNICYNLASAQTWSRIFDIHSLDDVVKNLENYYNRAYNANKNCPGWYTDQEILTRKVTEYGRDHEVIFLDTLGQKIRRLDKRDRKEILARRTEIIQKIGEYTDFHMTSKNQVYINLSNAIKEAIFRFLSDKPE